MWCMVLMDLDYPDLTQVSSSIARLNPWWLDRGKEFSGMVLELGVVMWAGTQILYLETGMQA